MEDKQDKPVQGTPKVKNEISYHLINDDKFNLLIEKIEGGKKRDFWDRFQILASFVSSVLFAGVGLFFTTTYNSREEIRQAKMDLAQLEMNKEAQKAARQVEKSQQRVQELNAVTSLTPFLASKDAEVRRLAYLILRSIEDNQDNKLSDKVTAIGKQDFSGRKPAGKPMAINEIVSPSTLLDRFKVILLADNSSVEERKAALKSIGSLALSSETSKADRLHAAKIVSQVALSENLPEAIKSDANELISTLRAVQYRSIPGQLAGKIVLRPVKEITLTHSKYPSISSYGGNRTMQEMKKFAVKDFGWTDVGCHYYISPDGLIWIGRDLDAVPAAISSHNEGTVAVQLILNGDIELPTAAQQKSLGFLLSTLCKKFSIDPGQNFAEGSGFRSDYNKGKPNYSSSPGKLIKKSMVLDWIQRYGKTE